MHFLGLAAALAVIECVTATPVQVAAATPSFVNYIDNFDDRQTPTLSVGIINAVGTYGALQYHGFSIANSTAQLLTPKPPSRPNYIFGGLTDTNQMQLVPANSTITKFNLYALNYACVVNAEGSATGCTIQVAGRKAAGNGFTTAVRELVYNPTGAVGNSFNFVVFPSTDFNNLVDVTISVISAKVPDLTLAVFDNVNYRAFTK